MKKLTIIARYNEDISWSKNLDSDIFIYNKGDDWPWDDIPRVDISNYGREAETYARAIIEFYKILDKYDVVCFLQGNPFDHFDTPIESINMCNKDCIQYLANSTAGYHYGELELFFDKSNLLISKLFSEKFIFKANYSNLINDQKSEVANVERGSEVLSTLLFADILNLKSYEKGIAYPAGAQYIIPTKYIKNKSYAWWEEFYKLILAWKYLVPDKDIAGYCERTWPLIWNHESNLHRETELFPNQKDQFHP